MCRRDGDLIVRTISFDFLLRSSVSHSQCKVITTPRHARRLSSITVDYSQVSSVIVDYRQIVFCAHEEAGNIKTQ